MTAVASRKRPRIGRKVWAVFGPVSGEPGTAVDGGVAGIWSGTTVPESLGARRPSVVIPSVSAQSARPV